MAFGISGCQVQMSPVRRIVSGTSRAHSNQQKAGYGVGFDISWRLKHMIGSRVC